MNKQSASWQSIINHNATTLRDYLDPNSGQMTIPEFERKLKFTKAS